MEVGSLLSHLMIEKNRPEDRFDYNVFINCPFDKQFTPMLHAIVFTVHLLGFRARCSQEITDGTDRLTKIMNVVVNSKYGIHDLSRIQGRTPRFNMPFELGIDIGSKHAGNSDCRTKHHLVLVTKAYEYQKFISDLLGRDPVPHNDRVTDVIPIVRNWLNNAIKGTPRHPFPSGSLVNTEYRKFQKALPQICKKLKLTERKLTFNDFAFVAATFITERSKIMSR
jgi:hypothetical protein